MAPTRPCQPARTSLTTNMKLHSQRTGSKSVLFTFDGDDHTRAYKWSKYGNRPNEDLLAIAAAVPVPSNFARAASRAAASLHPQISAISELYDIIHRNFIKIRAEKNDIGGRKIARQRQKLNTNIQQILHPNERAEEIIKRLYLLGKAAGMTALLE
uniref:Uncharacterized protein n=1 Tax=Panagrolaimus superbus TaxID=310955 RepID=A0A914Z9P4_9BILA